MASSIAGSLIGSVGAITQGQQQKAVYESNAKMQRMQALDAQRRGSTAEGQAREQSKLFTGAQNARQGGSGVIAGQDTGLDVLAESAEYGAMDATTIRINADVKRGDLRRRPETITRREILLNKLAGTAAGRLSSQALATRSRRSPNGGIDGKLGHRHT